MYPKPVSTALIRSMFDANQAMISRLSVDLRAAGHDPVAFVAMFWDTEPDAGLPSPMPAALDIQPVPG
jgi:hypothetical protein